MEEKFYMSPDLVLSKALHCSVKHTNRLSVSGRYWLCVLSKEKILSLVNEQEGVKT